jgi:glucose/mannose-6-phosphate isomerase
MRQEVEDFSKQLVEAMGIAEAAKFTELNRDFNNVIIAGMGGSGIGGTIVASILLKEAKIPINTNKDYKMPEYVDEKTLVIISSYSGNTEETVYGMKDAQERGAKIVCIASGGIILEAAEKEDLDFVQTPSGKLPRACLGYSLVSSLYILRAFGIIPIDIDLDGELKRSIALIDQEEDNIQKEAKEIAEFFHGKTPVLYPVSDLEGAAVRLRQQINENAKMLCWHHPLPEMHHNELLGWRDGRDDLGVVIIKHEEEHEQMEKRIKFTQKTLANFTPNLAEIIIKGNSLFENIIYFIHLGDWVSVWLAEMRDVDPDEMEVIEELKKELKK